MAEESHLDEMRTAIRGDFERLAERRGEQGLMRVTGEDAQDAPLGDPPHEEPPVEPPRRSWLARLVSP